jgi:hypothetical protein
VSKRKEMVASVWFVGSKIVGLFCTFSWMYLDVGMAVEMLDYVVLAKIFFLTTALYYIKQP